MHTAEIARQKYLRLMTQVEELEDRIADLEKELADLQNMNPPQADEELRAEIRALQEELAGQRTELQRVSDGCGTPGGNPHPA